MTLRNTISGSDPNVSETFTGKLSSMTALPIVKVLQCPTRFGRCQWTFAKTEVCSVKYKRTRHGKLSSRKINEEISYTRVGGVYKGEMSRRVE